MPETEITLTPAERLRGLVGRAMGRLPVAAQLKLSGRPAVELDGQRLDPCLQLLLAANRKRERFGLCDPDPVTARERFRREIFIYGGAKTRVGPVRDFEIDGEAGPLRARHYAPPPSAGDSRDLLVYLHGGGFVLGDLETHDEPCRLLCLHARTHVLSVEYRLAPEHPFPAGLGDALAALRWAQANAARLGADPARVSIGGDSAGGNLAAAASQLAPRDEAPAAQLLIYPATDASDRERRRSKELFGRGFFLAHTDCDAFARYYAEGTDARPDDPRVSPLCAPDLSGLAPALVVTAGFDLLRDEGDDYARALEAAGNVVAWRRYPSLGHGFMHLTGVCPAARSALVEFAREWRALLDRAAPAPRPALAEVLHEEVAP
ncbi:MAG TPA: alpha/beta hydrolase [Pyrinomonadaceae bacterium]|jgi:acetyl esterase